MSFRDYLSPPVATATVATIATVNPETRPSVAEVATVAVVSPSQRKIDAYHRHWSAAWRDQREQQIPESVDAALADAVLTWNAATDDARAVDELRVKLSTEDVTDPELMAPAWLALYCWTLWHDGG